MGINMQTGTVDFNKRNSVLRWALRDWRLIAAGSILVIGFVALVSLPVKQQEAFRTRAWIGGTCLCTSLGLLGGLVGTVKSSAIYNSLIATKELQAAYLQKVNPDIVVAFSWGGAVCAMLM